MITLQKLKQLIGKDPESMKAPENDVSAIKRVIREAVQPKQPMLKHTHLVTVHMHDPLTSGVQARIVRNVKVQADSDEAAMQRAIQYFKAKGVSKAVASKVKQLKEVGGAGEQGTDKLANKYKKDTPGQVKEALYQGREVPLNKPMQGDVKKSKVFVKDPKTGNVKKVNFGDKKLSIKKDQPARKRSYCARSSGLGNLTDKTKANYWSRKAWEC